MLFLFTVIVGCTSSPKISNKHSNNNTSIVSISDALTVKKRLYSQLEKWGNVKYKLGGLSKSGIDCSGFVYLTFRSEFGVQLPRSTEQQANVGKYVKQRNLKVGDLIFFKTSRNVRHLGVYMGARTFIHASTSRGVTISKLDNEYWKKRYWKSVRVNL